VDTTRFFAVAVDAFGDCVSSSPSTSTTQHGAAFPATPSATWCAPAPAWPPRVFHLRRLHAVLGVSMGGMQTFEWLADYPEFLDEAVPIVGTPQQTRMTCSTGICCADS